MLSKKTFYWKQEKDIDFLKSFLKMYGRVLVGVKLKE